MPITGKIVAAALGVAVVSAQPYNAVVSMEMNLVLTEYDLREASQAWDWCVDDNLGTDEYAASLCMEDKLREDLYSRDPRWFGSKARCTWIAREFEALQRKNVLLVLMTKESTALTKAVLNVMKTECADIGSYFSNYDYELYTGMRDWVWNVPEENDATENKMTLLRGIHIDLDLPPGRVFHLESDYHEYKFLRDEQYPALYVKRRTESSVDVTSGLTKKTFIELNKRIAHEWSHPPGFLRKNHRNPRYGPGLYGQSGYQQPPGIKYFNCNVSKYCNRCHGHDNDDSSAPAPRYNRRKPRKNPLFRKPEKPEKNKKKQNKKKPKKIDLKIVHKWVKGKKIVWFTKNELEVQGIWYIDFKTFQATNRPNLKAQAKLVQQIILDLAEEDVMVVLAGTENQLRRIQEWGFPVKYTAHNLKNGSPTMAEAIQEAQRRTIYMGVIERSDVFSDDWMPQPKAMMGIEIFKDHLRGVPTEAPVRSIGQWFASPKESRGISSQLGCDPYIFKALETLMMGGDQDARMIEREKPRRKTDVSEKPSRGRRHPQHGYDPYHGPHPGYDPYHGPRPGYAPTVGGYPAYGYGFDHSSLALGYGPQSGQLVYAPPGGPNAAMFTVNAPQMINAANHQEMW